MYYVTMTDPFMSGWGMADGKINKLVFECDTKDEAHIVKQVAINRKDMEDIEIWKDKPVFSKTKYYVQIKNKDIYPSWYGDPLRSLG